MDRLALRLLLAGDAPPEVDPPSNQDDHSEKPETTLDIRIAAVITIAAVSLLGSLAPFVLKVFGDGTGAVPRIFASFAAGTILGLSFVHVLPESFHLLEELQGMNYPHLGGAVALFAVVALITLQSLSQRRDPIPVMRVLITPGGSASGPTALQEKTVDIEAAYQASERRAAAYFLELGCVVHSIIIGFDLGINKTDRSQVVALFIALCFHQFLEGISLGNTVAAAGFSQLKGGAMLVAYSLTTPLGVAIGIGVASSYQDGNQTAVGVQGVFDAVAGGILMYVGFVNLVVPEFFGLANVQTALWLRCATYAALSAGGACMCLIAYWA